MDEYLDGIDQSLVKQKDSNYLNSKDWICEKSKTNAHIWILQPPKYKKDLLINIEKCKLCGKEKIVIIKDIY